MIALILCAGLALAEPEPSITPPPVVVHPEELSESVEVTEPGEAEVKADGELVDPETVVVLERKDPTPFQRIISGFVWLLGHIIPEPYADEGLILLLSRQLWRGELWMRRQVWWQRMKRRSWDGLAALLGVVGIVFSRSKPAGKDRAREVVEQDRAAGGLHETEYDLKRLIQRHDDDRALKEQELAQLRAAHAEQLAQMEPLTEMLETILRQSTEEPA